MHFSNHAKTQLKPQVCPALLLCAVMQTLLLAEHSPTYSTLSVKGQAKSPCKSTGWNLSNAQLLKSCSAHPGGLLVHVRFWLRLKKA